MPSFLEPELTTFALCWRVERRDGVALGFTSHDRDLVVDGFLYRASPGVAPSAIEEGDVLDADALEVAGALTSDAISAADLRAGLWDGAAVILFAADWNDPAQFVQVARGTLGAVTLKRGGFSAELKGPGASLDRPFVEETSPECRAELGDRRCRIDMGSRRKIARVVSAERAAIVLDTAEPAPNGWAWGRLRWLDGPNGGLSAAVLASDGATVTLAAPPPSAPEPDTRVEMIEGCDKRLETCAARFGNAVNFRGEPYLPGTDLLTRHPGE